MKNNKQQVAVRTWDDFSLIADEIIQVLYQHGCTYQEVKQIQEYVNGKLANQKIRSQD